MSTVATAIGGGSSGAYLAGLAAVGGFFSLGSGGMVLGAAILNGIVLGSVAGGTLSLANMTVQQKVEASTLVTAMGMDGVVYFKNPETGLNEYRVKLEIPKGVGSKEVKRIVDNIYDAREELIDALKDEDAIKQKAESDTVNLNTKSAIELFEKNMESSNLTQDDIVVLSVIAWKNGNFNLFKKGVSKILTFEAENKSFLYYLFALDSLRSNDIKQAIVYLDMTLNENKYILEPIVLKINILANENFLKNEIEINKVLQFGVKNFDSDKYATFLNLTSLYYRAGTVYFSNKKYAQAKENYEKALAELGLLQKNFFGKQLKHTIELAIANSLYSEGHEIKADKIYYGIISDIDEEEGKAELDKIRTSYLGKNVKK